MFVNVGHEHAVQSSRILSVSPATGAPIKRLIHAAEDKGTVIDATNGKRTRTVVVLDTGHVMLSSLTPTKLAERLNATIPRQTSENAL